jgi:DNA mismatch endonuclease, patch repair protein
MSRIRGKDTRPELAVRRLVHGMGYRYRLHRADLPGKPDLVFAAKHKVIFVHGCFWHHHACRYGEVTPKTNAKFWKEKIATNIARDARNVQALQDKGWEVLVVWECEITGNSVLTDQIRRFIGKRNDHNHKRLHKRNQ